MRVIVLTLMEALVTAAVVTLTMLTVFQMSLPFALLLGAIGSATAPASSLMTIRQYRAKGDFVNTLMQVVALDDAVALLAFSACAAIAAGTESAAGFSVQSAMKPLVLSLAMMLGAYLLGRALCALLRGRSSDHRLVLTCSAVFLIAAVCAAMDVSPLLGCMSMGMTYINLTGDEKLFRQLGYWSPPILLLFFVRSGLSFNLGALTDTLGASGSVPLLLVGILYFAGRIVGKYAGAYLGALAVGKGKGVRNYLGLALIPQAGVAIGLAAMGARTLGGEMGEMLQTIILASSVLYELVGPGCSKLALFLSGSYGHDVPEAPRVAPAVPKSRLETLIERMKTIEARLPDPVETSAEEELAFTQAAQEQYDLAQYYHNRRFKGGRSTGGIHP